MTRILAPCGTAAACRRHYRHGEKPDEACRLETNRYHRELAKRCPGCGYLRVKCCCRPVIIRHRGVNP